LDTTVRTSGICSNCKRALRKICAASSCDTLEGMSQFTQNVPSLSSGKNSEPSCAAATNDAAKQASAICTTLRGRVNAQSSTGV